MQTNKHVLRAMVESEEVSLQATAEAREGFCCSKCESVRQGGRSTVWGPNCGTKNGKLSRTSGFLTLFKIIIIDRQLLMTGDTNTLI